MPCHKITDQSTDKRPFHQSTARRPCHQIRDKNSVGGTGSPAIKVKTGHWRPYHQGTEKRPCHQSRDRIEPEGPAMKLQTRVQTKDPSIKVPTNRRPCLQIRDRNCGGRRCQQITKQSTLNVDWIRDGRPCYQASK